MKQLVQILFENYDDSNYQFCTECIVEGDSISRRDMKEAFLQWEIALFLQVLKIKLKFISIR